MLALALQILTLAATSVTASGTFINATTYTVAITVAPGRTVPLSLKPGARGPSWAAWPKRILVEFPATKEACYPIAPIAFEPTNRQAE